VQKAASSEYHLTCRNGSFLLAVTLSIIPNPGYGQQVPPTNPTVQPSQQPGAYSLQVNSQIVVLDVVVNNKKGEPMPNLTREDFKVYEDKVPQPILSFEPAATAAAQATFVPMVINSTAELDKHEPKAPVSIIVLDEVTTKFQDEAFARYSLKRYLNGQSDTLQQPTMLVAVNFKNIMVLRDYTTSRKEILDALERHFAGYNWQAVNGSWKGEQFNAAFASLIAVAEATSGHPGHKNMIWVGRGFPSLRWDRLPTSTQDQLRAAISHCANVLRDARVTLYAIDPVGLSAEPPATDEDGFFIDDPFGGQVDFDTMAQATGGQAFHGRNDVDRLIGTGVSDGETFYTLTYRPATVSQNPKEFRKIQVLMKDRNLRATTREGYFSATAPVAPALNSKGKPSTQLNFDLNVAGGGLMVYDGIPLTVVRDSAKPDSFILHFRAANLEWQNVAGDKRSSELSVLVASFDKKGKMMKQSADIIRFDLPAVPAGATTDDSWVNVAETISTAAPAARLRFVVRCNTNGKVGAENVFLVDRKTLSDPATGLKPERSK
jgi:VWFA-related protein